LADSRLLSWQAFTVRLEIDVQRAHRYGRALSVGLIVLSGVDLDLDPEAREAVLAAAGEEIAAGVRDSDLACRTSGAEFAVLLAETPAEQAERATIRVVEGVEDAAARSRRLVAVGAVAELASNESPEALLARARRALDATGISGKIAVAPPPDQRTAPPAR
jgi:diguanylate cyclase (GGDEF)-like protein